MSFNAIRENKILPKISGFTVLPINTKFVVMPLEAKKYIFYHIT